MVGGSCFCMKCLNIYIYIFTYCIYLENLFCKHWPKWSSDLINAGIKNFSRNPKFQPAQKNSAGIEKSQLALGQVSIH